MIEIFKREGENYLISYRKFPHYIFGHNIFTIFALISNQALGFIPKSRYLKGNVYRRIDPVVLVLALSFCYRWREP